MHIYAYAYILTHQQGVAFEMGHLQARAVEGHSHFVGLYFLLSPSFSNSLSLSLSLSLMLSRSHSRAHYTPFSDVEGTFSPMRCEGLTFC